MSASLAIPRKTGLSRMPLSGARGCLVLRLLSGGGRTAAPRVIAARAEHARSRGLLWAPPSGRGIGGFVARPAIACVGHCSTALWITRKDCGKPVDNSTPQRTVRNCLRTYCTYWYCTYHPDPSGSIRTHPEPFRMYLSPDPLPLKRTNPIAGGHPPQPPVRKGPSQRSSRRPRILGTNQRTQKTNPRANETNPRALGFNPRACAASPEHPQAAALACTLQALGVWGSLPSSALRARARRLAAVGLTPERLRMLWDEAQRGRRPAALLAWWLATPTRWLNVLLSIQDREKHGRLAARRKRVSYPTCVRDLLRRLGLVR